MKGKPTKAKAPARIIPRELHVNTDNDTKYILVNTLRSLKKWPPLPEMRKKEDYVNYFKRQFIEMLLSGGTARNAEITPNMDFVTEDMGIEEKEVVRYANQAWLQIKDLLGKQLYAEEFAE